MTGVSSEDRDSETLNIPDKLTRLGDAASKKKTVGDCEEKDPSVQSVSVDPRNLNRVGDLDYLVPTGYSQ